MRFPLVIELAAVPVLCIGGGPVALRKAAPLLESGAVLTLISPDAEPTLSAAAVHWVQRPYTEGDVAAHPTARLVLAATSSRAVNDQVEAECDRLGKFCLRIDGGGAVSLAGLIRRSGVLIAVSTGIPALSQRLRDHIEEGLDRRWGVAAKLLVALRRDPEVRAALAEHDPDERRRRWQRATDAALDEGPEPLPTRSRTILMEGGDA